MKRHYGVVWREGTRPLATGNLELMQGALRLEGLSDSHAVACEIPYDRLTAVHVGRSNGDRISGRPTVVLERRPSGTVRIATIAEPGSVGEIVERLSTMRSKAEYARQAATAYPVIDQCSDVVALLLEQAFSRPRGDSESTNSRP